MRRNDRPTLSLTDLRYAEFFNWTFSLSFVAIWFFQERSENSQDFFDFDSVFRIWLRLTREALDYYLAIIYQFRLRMRN